MLVPRMFPGGEQKTSFNSREPACPCSVDFLLRNTKATRNVSQSIMDFHAAMYLYISEVFLGRTV